MKKTVVTRVLLIVALLFSGLAVAKGKVGYVNLQKVVNESAYSQRLRDQVTKELTPLGEEIRALSTQINSLRQTLNKDGLTMQQSNRLKIERELRGKVLELKLREANFKEEGQYRERQALDQVTKKAIEEVEKIAKKQGYDIIVQSEAVLYATDAVDLTDALSKSLK